MSDPVPSGPVPTRPLRPSPDGWRRPRGRVAVLLGVLLLAASGCTVTSAEPADADPPVRIATTSDPEGQVLAAVLVALVEDADLGAEAVGFGDGGDARQALQLGAVDVAVGYTGEAWLEQLGRADPPGDPEASFRPVRTDDARRGITWLPPRFDDAPGGAPANATFAFVVRGPPGAHADLRTVSQLAARLGERPEATVCVDREFGTREDGLRAVLDAYRVRSDRPFVAADPAEAVQAVAEGGCIAGLTTATDGAAWAAGLRPLEDDLGVFPAFVVTAQVRDEALDAHPGLRQALHPLSELTTAAVGGWSARVLRGDPLDEVAADAIAELRVRASERAVAEQAVEDAAQDPADDGDDAAG